MYWKDVRNNEKSYVKQRLKTSLSRHLVLRHCCMFGVLCPIAKHRFQDLQHLTWNHWLLDHNRSANWTWQQEKGATSRVCLAKCRQSASSCSRLEDQWIGFFDGSGMRSICQRHFGFESYHDLKTQAVALRTCSLDAEFKAMSCALGPLGLPGLPGLPSPALTMQSPSTSKAVSNTCGFVAPPMPQVWMEALSFTRMFENVWRRSVFAWGFRLILPSRTLVFRIFGLCPAPAEDGVGSMKLELNSLALWWTVRTRLPCFVLLTYCQTAAEQGHVPSFTINSEHARIKRYQDCALCK